MKGGRALRVALVGPAPHHLGGTAALIKGMLRDLPSAGVEARAVATDTIPSWLPQPLDRVKYLRTGLRFAAYLARLARAALWADVVHAFAGAYLSFFLEPLPAVIVGRALGKRVVLNYHTGEAEDHLRRSRRLVRWAVGRAHVLVVPSQYLQKIFERAGMSALVIPNSVDLPAGAAASPAGPVIVNTRALEPIYDIPCTLRAFALVQGQYPQARLILVGRGSEADRCRRLAGELGLRGVEFIGGVAHDEVPKYLSRASLLLNSSRIDNQPLSILEALASGVPVVSTAAGGIVEIVQHEETGLVAPIGDHAALAAQACRVLADAALAKRLSDAGRAVAARHTWPALRDMWLDAYGAAQQAPAATAAPDTGLNAHE